MTLLIGGCIRVQNAFHLMMILSSGCEDIVFHVQLHLKTNCILIYVVDLMNKLYE